MKASRILWNTPTKVYHLKPLLCLKLCGAINGAPFDLEHKLHTTANFEDNNGDRGRGLKILFELADGLSYEPTVDERYCLWIKKYY